MAALWRACVPLVCALLVATGRGAVLKVVTSDVGEDAQIAFVSGGAPQGSTVTMTRAEGTGPLEIHEGDEHVASISAEGGVEVATALSVAGDAVATNSTVTQLKQALDAALARIEKLEQRVGTFSMFRVPASQTLNDGFTGWSGMEAVSASVAFTMRNSISWDSRTADEKELLIAMGRNEAQHLYTSFTVYRISWTNRAGSWIGPWQKIPAYHGQEGHITSAAFIKMESGEISADGINYMYGCETPGPWKLCGRSFLSYWSGGYNHLHPGTVSASGSFLIALPATVYGEFDLTDPRDWWLFPAVGAI